MVRRRKRRLKGTDISFPYESSAKKLRQMLAHEVRNAIISVGHQINPNLFSKPFVKNDVIKKNNLLLKDASTL